MGRMSKWRKETKGATNESATRSRVKPKPSVTVTAGACA